MLSFGLVRNCFCRRFYQLSTELWSYSVFTRVVWTIPRTPLAGSRSTTLSIVIYDSSTEMESDNSNDTSLVTSIGNYSTTQRYEKGLEILSTAYSLDVELICDFLPPQYHHYPPGYLACPNFFSSINPDLFISNVPLIQWDYSMRRDVHRITPFLYLGPASAAKNEELVRKNGFTLLLAVRTRQPFWRTLISGDKIASHLGIESAALEVNDDQELITTFLDAVRRINDHICCCPLHARITQPQGQKKVLLFCETGNSKAAAMAAAYLMAIYNISAASAMTNTQTRRLCTLFEESVKRQLFALESILQAKQDVTIAQSSNRNHAESNQALAPPSVSRKRSSSVLGESEDDMEVNGGAFIHNSRRVGQAPFADIP